MRLSVLRHKFRYTNVELVKSTLMNYYNGEVLQGGIMYEGDFVLQYFGGHFVQGGFCPGGVLSGGILSRGDYVLDSNSTYEL